MNIKKMIQSKVEELVTNIKDSDDSELELKEVLQNNEFFTQNDLKKLEESLNEVVDAGFYIDKLNIKTYNIGEHSRFENLYQCLYLEILYGPEQDFTFKEFIELLMKFSDLQERLYALGYGTKISPKADMSIDIRLHKLDIQKYTVSPPNQESKDLFLEHLKSFKNNTQQ